MKKKISKNKNFQSRIVVGDAIKILKKIPNKFKFDVVIADPPYNIGKDFGNNNDKMDIKKYTNWSKRWIEQCFRLLADDGVIYIYGYYWNTDNFLTRIYMFLYVNYIYSSINIYLIAL